ncbi:hypothetical protein G4Y73_09435 [Wenzhouxiangella sp. XN201]|uniref:hypothetical protein n=1 Tax=Wenzhouxiangella sp. XN201 TaxID=2710755 RepID=UPI0013C76430|nr:hypothetical protein [Wenzhouxiangella sp. XN201]NEZ04366.1 hypothetical protein [Wenzhouxiangella sp. XN201]
MAAPAAPVLIERSLLTERDRPDARCIEQVVSFQRKGHRILLVAPRPRSWRPTRRNVDRDLALQQQFHQLFMRAGAELDGVLYFGTGLFSRREKQKNDFQQTARRYGRNVGEMALIGADQDLIAAADRAGLKLCVVGDSPVDNGPAFDDLKTALANVD